MIDYACFYRRAIRRENIERELAKYDVFVSAFNASDRVRTVFDRVRADQKFWLVHPEYLYTEVERPRNAPTICPEGTDESVQVRTLLEAIGDLTGKTVCIDITGFMRHVLAFLVAMLSHVGVREFTALYSEPDAYAKQEHTRFATTTSGGVRSIRGMGGVGAADGVSGATDGDYLVLGVGYDYKLINEVTTYKDSSTVFPLFSFPSLSADMYQQSAVSAARSGGIILSDDWTAKRRFAPANDPFSTASVVQEMVAEIERASPEAEIALSPLATKVQVLGFALYWCLEGKNKGTVSVLLPECLTYSRETSSGLRRLWSYTVEFFAPPAQG
ncbi:hypothetical protein [Burkholderia ubonensis]|uniref:hypothetical protein n=1 Tax=Burkholderia ubonensis TaxID=101571 RepID=UPI0009B46614|nr:hypothetical protein [Burkholderia ubonensis]